MFEPLIKIAESLMGIEIRNTKALESVLNIASKIPNRNLPVVLVVASEGRTETMGVAEHCKYTGWVWNERNIYSPCFPVIEPFTH